MKIVMNKNINAAYPFDRAILDEKLRAYSIPAQEMLRKKIRIVFAIIRHTLPYARCLVPGT